jgi:sulfur carrier protein ThiS
MKKKIKIKIKINGKIKNVDKNSKLSNIIKNFKIPLKKVAIELNEEIVKVEQIKKEKMKTNNET